jgi:hypothetical protein
LTNQQRLRDSNLKVHKGCPDGCGWPKRAILSCGSRNTQRRKVTTRIEKNSNESLQGV